MLAANRVNAKKSTGARTPEGKARVALNALKHGRRAKRVRQSLIQAGMQEGERLYRWLLERLARTFEPKSFKDWRQADRMARQAWSEFWRRRGMHQTEPECPLESDSNNSQLSSLLRIRIDDVWRRRGLVFWLQRHRHWTFDRWIKLVEDAAAGKPREGPVRRWGSMERRLRARRFRLARLPLWQQQALEQARRGKRAIRP